MSEIKVGEYVRTESGEIGIIKNILQKSQTWLVVEWQDKNKSYYLEYSKDLKHSKDIIDLIEVSDYVNGKYVYKITAGCIYFKGYATENKSRLWIQSIVTHEQFKNIEYKVGD